MAKRTYRPTFIRQWRKHRRLSLDRLALRLVDPLTNEPLLSKQSLSRIERGLQPYRQPILEAVAEALSCSPGDLLMRDPTDPDAMWSIWEGIPEHKRNTALQVLKALRGEPENDKAA